MMRSTSPKLVKLLLLLPVLSLSLPAMADESEQADTKGDVMVVTASAIEQSLKTAPASISVITREDLDNDIGKSATDLVDVLERVTGISKAIGTDVSSGVQIRGMPAAYTLILVNGRRMGSSNGTKTTQQNYFDDINWIPVDSIERIEVVRGPMSSLYGSDAMGGVINIITKKETDEWRGSFTAGVRVPEEDNRGKTQTYTGSIAGPLGNGFHVRLGGSWNERKPDTSETSALRWGSGTEGKRRYNYEAELGWDINDNHQVSIGTTQGQEKGLEGETESGTEINLRGATLVKRESYFVNYQGLFDFGNVKLTAYQNKYRNQASNIPEIIGGALTGNTYESDLWSKDQIIEGSISIPFELLVEHDLTVGAQWMKEELYNPRSIGTTASSDTFGQHTNDAISKSIFFEDQMYLRDDLTLTLGLRFDDTKYGNETTPRAYLVYNPTDEWTFKGGYSEGFKAPSLRQSSPGFIETSKGAGCNGYADYTGGGCYTVSNANLKAERSENWELGASYDHQGWHVEVTFFDSRFKDKIATSPVGYIPGDPTGRYWLERINLDSARTQGIEARLDIPLISQPVGPILKSLTLRNNFTRMIKAEDDRGVMLVTTPKFTSYSTLDWQLNDAFGMSLSAKYYSKMLGLNSDADQASRGNTATARIRSGYFVYDLAANYKVTENLRFNIGVDNLFDKDPVTDTPSGSATTGNNYYIPGRTFYASLTASF